MGLGVRAGVTPSSRSAAKPTHCIPWMEWRRWRFGAGPFEETLVLLGELVRGQAVRGPGLRVAFVRG